MTRVPSDVVKGVFHYLGKSYRFPADLPKINRVFNELSKKMEYSKLLEEFVFDETRSYPYCETISFALDRLQLSSLLACINPSLDQYEISEKLASDKKIEGLFSTNERTLLEDIASSFQKQIVA